MIHHVRLMFGSLSNVSRIAKMILRIYSTEGETKERLRGRVICRLYLIII